MWMRARSEVLHLVILLLSSVWLVASICCIPSSFLRGLMRVRMRTENNNEGDGVLAL